MRTQIRNATLWSLSAHFLRAILQVFFSILLMRLVRPEYFGLVAMVNIVVVFLEIFKSVSTDVALIQKSEVSEGEVSSLFWFNVFIGLFLAAIMSTLPPLISSFYNDEDWIITISFCFAATLFINGFNTIPYALLYKKLDFKSIFWMEVFTVVISGTVAVLMAIKGFQMGALLSRIVLMAVLPLMFWLFFLQWKPALSFQWKEVSSHFLFGLPVLADNLLNFCVRNLDDILVGKFLGKTQLGIYNRGYSLLLFPLSTFSSAVSRVILPVFSAAKSDLHFVKATYLKTTRMLAFVTFPLMLIVFLCSEPLILLVLGKGWGELIPLIQVFAVLGAAQSIGTLDGAVYQSLGKTYLQFQVGVVTKVFMVLMILSGFIIYRGILGVAKFYAIGSIIAGIWGWHCLGKLFGARLSEMLHNLFPVLGLTLLTGFIVHWEMGLLNMGSINFIVLSMASVLIIFTFAGFCLFPDMKNELRSILKLLIWKS